MARCAFYQIIRRLNILIFLLVLAAVVVLGCKGEKSISKSEDKKSPVVAKVGSSSITTSELTRYLSDRTLSKRSLVSEEAINKMLDEMVMEKILYQEAISRKLDQEPEVQKSIRQMINRQLMKQIEEDVSSRELDEKEIQQYYDEHKDEFNSPAKVRVADIFIAVPRGATKQQKAEARKRAEEALTEALKVQGNRMGFGPLIRKYSDKPEKYQPGDTGFFDNEGNPVGLDKALAGAAFSLADVGRISEKLIETPDGYHIIMLTAKRPAINKPLEEVRNAIVQRIRHETVTKARESFIASLKEKTSVDIDKKAVADVLTALNEERSNKPAIERRQEPPMASGPPALLR